METVIVKTLQLILSLSILVLVHECGHFLFARLFKVRVDKFYLFFNPWFTLFKWKPRNSETEYGIGWLPLGGYVKIAGMIDESMDREALKQPPQPWEFRTRPAWQRLFMMIGGVLMNFILAFFIYSMVVLAWGDNYIPIQKTPLYFGEVAHRAGFQDGDILLTADGTPLSRYDDLDLFRVIDAENVSLLRNGDEIQLSLPKDFKAQFLTSKAPFADLFTAQVDSVVSGSNAERAGLQADDRIISINEKATNAFATVSLELAAHKNSEVALGVVRRQDTIRLMTQIDAEGRIGFFSHRPSVSVCDRYDFFQSIPKGIELGVRKMAFYLLQLKLVFSKAGISGIGGFGAIGNLFPPTWDWFSFWMMTALLSIMLGVMNLLPIPALDGGHVLFVLYEIITRRQPSEKFLEYAQITGMVFLLSLLLYANGMDIVRAFFH
jgi:regulator of sigma E protease